jgi:excisionase family DNA binding protein
MTPDLLTTAEAARIARCSTRTIRRRANEGAFPAYVAGPRTIRIPRAGFMAWLWGPDAASFTAD